MSIETSVSLILPATSPKLCIRKFFSSELSVHIRVSFYLGILVSPIRIECAAPIMPTKPTIITSNTAIITVSCLFFSLSLIHSRQREQERDFNSSTSVPKELVPSSVVSVTTLSSAISSVSVSSKRSQPQIGHTD